jgi:nucleotide-binding universal stress UspA family protein
MKNILVPTDFSSSSNNAAIYAAALAKELNAKIILLHSFHVPIPPSDIPVTAISVEELQKNNERFLAREVSRIHRHYDVKVGVSTRAGFAVDEIYDLEKEKKPDLIIMGMKGAGKVQEVLIGSTAISVIRTAKTPVLLIPETSAFVKPKKIILACDYKAGMNLDNLSFLKMVAGKLNSEIFLVNVVLDKESIPAAEKGVEGMGIAQYMGNIKCSSHFPLNKDFISGIDDFLNKQEVEMITIIPQKHNLLERLFSESHTKRMAFHSEIPLLTLPS